MRNEVLITSVSRKVSLIKAFKDAGWIVYGHDINDKAVGLKFCNYVQKNLPPTDSVLWIPTRDAEIKEAYKHNGWSTKSVDICLDKVSFHDWCIHNGFDTPRISRETVVTKTRGLYEGHFVKPRFSSSINKEIGNTECILQEVLKGDEYSIDLFADFKGRVISCIPRLRLQTVSGESVFTVTVKQESLLENSVDLSSKLGLIGHNVLQGFMVGSKFYWTDVNCRFGGASIVGIKAGCKSPEWLLKLVNTEEVKPCVGEYVTGLVGKSWTEWGFYEN